MDRRDFLRAALAGPTIITTAALGNANTPPASDRINLGFIGTGGRGGDGHINEEIQHADCQCVAVCDPFRDRREKRSKQIDAFYAKQNGVASYKSAAMYSDFRELLRRTDIDAVCVATPDHWHVPIAIAAARAGKDVLVEKPLSPSIAWNMALRKVIHKTGRVFQYGTQQRGAAHVRFACEIVRSGRLGKLKSIEVIAPTGAPGGATAQMPVPDGLDWEMWQGPAPARPFNPDRCVTPGHYHITDYSVGFLGGWGAHPLDVLDWCFPTPTVPVEYEGTGLIPKEGLFDTVMRWDARCTYADGVVLAFKGGQIDSTKFVGENGWIRIARAGMESEPKDLLAGYNGPTGRFAMMGRNHARNFLDAIRKKVPPESDIDSACRSDLISHLTNIAVRTGRKIKWDPAKERIVGDKEAQKMVPRAMRKPWNKFA
jgi:glucose-fructose oxidoreductase